MSYRVVAISKKKLTPLRWMDGDKQPTVEGVVAQLLFDDGGKTAKAFAKIDGIAVQVYPRHIMGRSEVLAHVRRLSSW